MLQEFLLSFPELEGEDIEAIAQHIPVQECAKGTLLQEEGKVPSSCYFVLKGLVREYTVHKGMEQSIEFFDEDQGAISSEYYAAQKPAESTLVCVEDCLLITGNQELDIRNFEKFPVLRQITNVMLEADLNSRKLDFSRLISAQPKERYLYLLEQRPSLFQRVPQHQIASYLGMTPESLSRVRKRISKS